MRRSCHVLILLSLLSAAAAGDSGDSPILVIDSGGHTSKVNNVMFTPDGRQLISASNDKTIRFWDVATGSPLRVLRPPIGPGSDGALYTAAMTPDGTMLAAGGYGWTDGPNPIYLIAVGTGRIERVLQGHTNVVCRLAFAPDGRRLASGGADHTARVWDLETGRCERVLTGHTDCIYGIAFSPDGRRLVTGSDDGTGRIWSVEDGHVEAVLRGGEGHVNCVAWRPDGLVIATGGRDRAVHLWGPDGSRYQGYERLPGRVFSLTFSVDSRQLLYTLGGRDSENRATLMDLVTGHPRVQFTRHTNSVLGGTLSRDGTLAATSGGDDWDIYIWRTSDGTPVQKLTGRGRSKWSAGWGRDGDVIAWGDTYRYRSKHDRGSLERAFRLSDLEWAAAPDDSFQRARPTLGWLSLESDGETAVAVKEGTKTIATLKMKDPSETVRCFTLLPGDRAAVGTVYDLYLFDARSGRRIRRFRGHTSAIFALAPSPDGRYLLSASQDQTLRAWDTDRDQPLLSLFFAGDDWVAWTPEGYYAASPAGERLMGWQVNRGREAMGSYYPATDFHKTFYRPDVIKALLRAGGIVRAMAESHEPATPMTIGENLPPLVAITSPDRSPATLAADELEVRAVARSRAGQPVTAMRLLVDSRPYEGRRGLKAIVRERAEAGDVHESWAVRLAPGPHRLAVVAESRVSKATSDEVEVLVPAPRAERPALYVLAVGISAYPGRLRLNYAAADARALAATLREKAAPLYERVEVRLVTDADATRRGIIAGLNWLKARVTDRDVAVVFYSGHGDVGEDGVFYFVPVDVDVSDLPGTGVHGSQFKATLAGMPGRVVALLDACHAGAAEGARRKALRGKADDLVRELISDDYGVVVMGSSTGGEESLEGPEVGHGYFTQALCEGLAGRADTNKDGLVYTTELDTYLYDRVKELSGDAQHPVTAKPASVRPFPLTRP